MTRNHLCNYCGYLKPSHEENCIHATKPAVETTPELLSVNQQGEGKRELICEGNCLETHEGHGGEVKEVIVYGHFGMPIKFHYCENAIEEDIQRGFTVEIAIEKSDAKDQATSNLEESCIKSALDELTDEMRMSIFSNYCSYCGSKDPSCQCWNDD